MSGDKEREYSYHFAKAYPNHIVFQGAVEVQTQESRDASPSAHMKVESHAWACGGCQTASILPSCARCDNDGFLMRSGSSGRIDLVCNRCRTALTPLVCSCGTSSYVSMGNLLRYTKEPILSEEERLERAKQDRAFNIGCLAILLIGALWWALS